MANQHLAFDVTKQRWLQKDQIVLGRQGDGNLKTITVNFLGNTEVYSLIGKSIYFAMLLPDGKHKVFDNHHTAIYNPKDGYFTYTFPPEALSVVGKTTGFFVVQQGDQQIDSTLPFDIEIIPNEVSDALVAGDYISPIIDLLNQVKVAESDIEDLVKKGNNAINQAIADIKKQTNDAVAKINNQLDSAIKAADDKLAQFITNAQKQVVDLSNKVDALNKKIADIEANFIPSNIGAIGVDTDWNTATKTGIYHVNQAKGANSPTGSLTSWGDLLVVNNGGWIEQHYFGATSNGHEYIRSYSGSPASWGKWYAIANLMDITTASLGAEQTI